MLIKYCIFLLFVTNLYFHKDRIYYHKYGDKWFGPVTYDQLIQNNVTENALIWYDGLCPKFYPPKTCIHVFPFKTLLMLHDSIISDSIKIKDARPFIDSFLECRNCFSLNKVSFEDIKCIIIFLTIIVFVILLVVWIAKKYKKENALMVAVIIGFITNLFTALIQNNIYYFSKDTVKQLEQHDTLLNNMKTLLKISYDIQHGVDTMQKMKSIANFHMESYCAVDFRVDKNLKIDTNLVVEIDVLEANYRWKCQSINQISFGEKKQEKEIGVWSIVKNYSNDQFKDAKGFVCIGSASSEGGETNEEERAEKRMKVLSMVFKKALPFGFYCPIYGLNLGKFIEEGKPIGCSSRRRDQRRVVILKITYQRHGITFMEFSSAIKKILVQRVINNSSDFPIDIRNYSKYQKNELTLQ